MHDVVRTTLVLGSRQTIDLVDRAAVDEAGVDVVVRRSGGGVVLVEPGNALWIDAFVPRGDAQWDDDVGRAAWWLGDAWAAAIGGPAHVHRGPMIRTEWSDLICFGGLGPGEVTLGGTSGTRSPKLVGISQRRTAAGALLQSVAFSEWDPVGTLRLLDLTPEARARAAADLAEVAAGLPIPLAKAQSGLMAARE